MNKTKHITERAVLYGGVRIVYTLERKSVKNINLRVRADKSVYVSANVRVPAGVCDEFVRSKGAFILDAQRRLSASQKNGGAKKYEDGEAFSLLGRTYRLKLMKGAREGVFTDGGSLCVVLKGDDKKRAAKLIDEFTAELCRDVFSRLLRARYRDFSSYTSGLPALRIRRMKSRWGSCIPSKNVITLNSRLIEKPPELIDYVVLHEYCHFVHPNHSKAFHALVASYMPDWKKRKAQLNA